MSLFTCWEQWSHASVLSDFRHLTLEGIRGGGSICTPLNFLALNFCSLTDYQKLWHNCFLLVKTSFDLN